MKSVSSDAIINTKRVENRQILKIVISCDVSLMYTVLKVFTHLWKYGFYPFKKKSSAQVHP